MIDNYENGDDNDDNDLPPLRIKEYFRPIHLGKL